MLPEGNKNILCIVALLFEPDTRVIVPATSYIVGSIAVMSAPVEPNDCVAYAKVEGEEAAIVTSCGFLASLMKLAPIENSTPEDLAIVKSVPAAPIVFPSLLKRPIPLPKSYIWSAGLG